MHQAFQVVLNRTLSYDMTKVKGQKPSKGGRPLKATPRQVATRAKTWEESDDRSMTGLARALGFSSRKQLLEYEKRDEFRETIQYCRLLVEHAYEKALLSGRPAAGPIFALKNMGWSDRIDHAHDGELEIRINHV